MEKKQIQKLLNKATKVYFFNGNAQIEIEKSGWVFPISEQDKKFIKKFCSEKGIPVSEEK